MTAPLSPDEGVRAALEAAKAALIRIRECSSKGAMEGYGKPELWADDLFRSHGDVARALKQIDAALSTPVPEEGLPRGSASAAEGERLRAEKLHFALATIMGTAEHGQGMSWSERCRIAREALDADEGTAEPQVVTIVGHYTVDKLLAGEEVQSGPVLLIPASDLTNGEPSPAMKGACDWATSRWHEEVANRPLQNVHRRALDTTWRQVIRHFGGDDEKLCGPRHDELVARAFPTAKEDGR